jgi:Holliday junction resolvase RusA-like endonuclease
MGRRSSRHIPAATSRRIKIDPALLVDDTPREPGSVVCAGVVEGRAVPWKEPVAVGKKAFQVAVHNGSRRSRDYLRYLSWQHEIRRQVAPVMGRHRPYGGRVAIDVVFYLHPKGGKLPDRSNLLKAFEDAIEGIVYVNDGQIQSGHTSRVIDRAEKQRVEFVVRAI